MKLLEFLQAVTPDDGVLLPALKVEQKKGDRSFTSFRHYPKTAHGPMFEQIMELRKTANDVYYALASFKQGFHEVTGKSGRTKKVVRVRENVRSLKALWFDIDFKQGYRNPAEVATALKEFTRKTGLPLPSILVHSGNGMHVYWPFTEAVPYARWQEMADALKALAKQNELEADLACTADPCRVLRPPWTFNFKDPDDPKEVEIKYSSGKLFEPDKLEALLQVDASPLASATVPSHLRNHAASYDEFTGSAGGEAPTAFFDEVSKHCGVMKHVLATHGAEAPEPEWSATLQLLKHCEDGELFVHDVSSGHPGYDIDETNEKWQQKVDNDSGPTLCETFHGFHPETCEACPYWKKIKTPLQVGGEKTETERRQGVVLRTWRPAKDGSGMQQLYKDEEGNLAWKTVIPYVIDNVEVTESIFHSTYSVNFTARLSGGKTIRTELPTAFLGNPRKLSEFLYERGVALGAPETKGFITLMSTWIKELQKASKVETVTEQLGWITDPETTTLTGFSVGETSFYLDGGVRSGCRIGREFRALGEIYKPAGKFEEWRRVADFLCEQNNPAMTTILASAFAAPLLVFTGTQGGLLSIVSTESGVGKTSALKTAQAVWGNPAQAMNSVDDTVLSVMRKLGFIKNLPAYWDELRGKRNMEEFLKLAFQITQGKEKTRLDSTATMKDVNTWQTMLVAASNESIFELMGRYGQGSDAGMARTFEVTVEPFSTDDDRAEVARMFGKLDRSFGHAGTEYAKWLVTNYDLVQEQMDNIYSQLSRSVNMQSPERFWVAMMAALIGGAVFAHRAGLCSINIPTLSKFLRKNLIFLRGESVAAITGSGPEELLAAYIQAHQDRVLVIDSFPSAGVRLDRYNPDILAIPKSGRLVAVLSEKENRVRVIKGDFLSWLRASKEMSYKKTQFENKLNLKDVRASLGGGTRYALPRAYLMEMDYNVNVGEFTEEYE